MRHHYRLFAETKQQYRDLFLQSKASLSAHLQTLRPAMSCPVCENEKQTTHTDNDTLPLHRMHDGCPNRHWQTAMLHFLETELARDILTRLAQIGAYRNTFSCHMCGMCCRLASSEHSYPELLERAAQGDDFAQQFTSIFLPYASREAARAKYPEVVAAVLAHVGEAIEQAENKTVKETVFFYHCPYIGEDNRCTVYGTDKRPAICENYPETSLGFMVRDCAWKPWQDETHLDTLLAHGLLNLCQSWSENLREALA
jgi:Fe-S-cluster containining protein